MAAPGSGYQPLEPPHAHQFLHQTSLLLLPTCVLEPTSAGLCTLLFCIRRPAQVASVVWSFTRMSRLQLPHQQQLMQQRPLVLQLAEASLSSSAAAQELTGRQTAVLAWGLHRLGKWASCSCAVVVTELADLSYLGVCTVVIHAVHSGHGGVCVLCFQNLAYCHCRVFTAGHELACVSACGHISAGGFWFGA